MKKIISMFATALAAAAGFAADPVAVWDGDFSTTEKTGSDGKTYTLTLPANVSVVDGCLSVRSGHQGAYVTISPQYDRNAAKLSVLMEYEGAVAQENAVPVYLEAEAYFGLKTKGDSLDILGDFWGTTYPTGSNPDTTTTMPASGWLLFVFPQGGVQAYSASTLSGLTEASAGGTISGLSFSNKPLQKIGLGGTASSKDTLNAFNGLKIKRVAIFNSNISTSDAVSYIFPSEIQQIYVTANTTVSAINAQIDSANYKGVNVQVANGVAISVDAAFDTNLPFSVESAGTITLSADSQPAASYFTGVDFSGVKGGLLRSWLTPGVVGFNFRSANGTDVSGALATTDNWIHDNNSASGTSTSMFADGLSTLKWSSGGTYSFSGSTILCGYLDDGANGGNGATVTLSNVPYETYDVIVYCSSDSNPGQFLAKTVNGTTYTWDSATGAVVAGNSVWGKAALSTPVYGLNALRIKNLSGPLTIYGTARNGSNRGGIAAFEIMPPETPDNIPTYKLTLNGTATTWSGGTWTLNSQTVDAPADGYVEIVASASTELTVDQAVSLTDLKVRGGENIVVNIANNGAGSLYAIRATVESGVFQQGSPAVLGTTPAIVVASGATFDENGMAVNAANAITIAGAGAGDWPWALTSSGGAGGAILGGLYLSADATIGGENELKVGQTQAGYYCYLQGFTLTKTGAGAFTGTNMNTPGTGTIDVQGGAMSVNQWNNLNSASGDTTVILNSGTSLANGTDRIISMSALGLYGGTLSTASKAFKVNTTFRGAGETANLAFGNGASAMLTGDLTITASLTLDGSVTFIKDAEAASDVVVTPAALTASSGTITVGTGVTLNVGTSRPTATITVAQGGTLAAQLQSASDVIELSTSAQPANVVLYDANGDVVSNARISYSEGTLTIMPSVPTLEANGTVAFDTESNWNDSAMPSENGEAIIQLDGDATITVSGTYSLGAITITGSGVATFSGEGSITVANISVKNGATFTRNANISATTGISLDSGTVLRLDGVTEGAAISGAGAVETYGTVVLAHANTMTGGITVKPGSALSTTAAGGYGEYQSSWAYTAQRQVVVEDGGTVDINNVANNGGAVALTIAGKGILSGGVYSGAVTYSGAAAITSGSRQISSLVLTGDAMVDVGAGWGLVHSGWGNARLGLSGYTLTVRGTGTFPVVNANNGAATTGTLVLDGATLELSNAASNLAGVNVIAKGCATINLATAPSALGSLTIIPTQTDYVIATAYNLPAGVKPVIDMVNLGDVYSFDYGDSYTMFARTDGSSFAADGFTILAPDGTDISADGILVDDGSKIIAVDVAGNKVVVAYNSNFTHYDFNNGAAKDTGCAADSNFYASFAGEYDTQDLVFGRNGKAVAVQSGGGKVYTPYWDRYSSNADSPLARGAVTVTTVARLDESNNVNVVLWGLGSSTSAPTNVVSLVAVNDSTVAVVTRKDDVWSKVVEVSGINHLKRSYHFIALVADSSGTTLYVDRLAPVTTTDTISFDVGTYGQIGSIHGGVPGADAFKINDKAINKVTNGYSLDDWAIYRYAMTPAQIDVVREKIFKRLKTLFIIR